MANVREYLSQVSVTSGPLFWGLGKQQKPIKASTLSSIVRDQVLGPDGAGVNAHAKKCTPKGIQFFDPDLLRGAAATCALLGGAAKEQIRCQARWADMSTFTRHYNRALQMATPTERKRMEEVATSGKGWPLHLALRRGVGASY